MNTKATIAAVMAIIMAASGIMVAAQSVDAQEDGKTEETAYQLGTYYIPLDANYANAAKFDIRINETAYSTQTYEVVWTISDGTNADVWTYEKDGTISETISTATFETSVSREAPNEYSFAISKGSVESATTLDLTITCQVNLKSGDKTLLNLNTVYHKIKIEFYGSTLADVTDIAIDVYENVSETLEFTGAFNPAEAGNTGGIYYATGLPEGLQMNQDGTITGMVNSESLTQEGKAKDYTVNLVYRLGGQEYYTSFTLTVNPDNVTDYTVTMTQGVQELTAVVESDKNDTYFVITDDNDPDTEKEVSMTLNGIDNEATVIVTVIGDDGQRTTITATGGSYDIPYDGAGKYTILIQNDVQGPKQVDLYVHSLTVSGTAGFVLVGN